MGRASQVLPLQIGGGGGERDLAMLEGGGGQKKYGGTLLLTRELKVLAILNKGGTTSLSLKGQARNIIYVLRAGYPLHRENGENGQTNSLSGKTQGIWKFAKTKGTWFAQVVHSLTLKVNNILKFAAKISNFFWLDKSAKSKFYVCNSHKSRKLAQRKFAVGQGKHREFETAI